MNICVIPARGGSKRIPNKNIKPFMGKPIISYSIEAALESNCFDNIIVSTDSHEIAEVALKYGANVPFMRPERISDDFTGTTPVIKHAIEWFIEHHEKPENTCCLYATAPFISSEMLQLALLQLNKEGAQYCFSATNYTFPIQRAIKISDNNRVEMFHSSSFEARSQDLEEAFHDAGQFYWGKSDAFIQEKVVFSKISTPYLLPDYLVQDIDTPEDWLRAEALYRIQQELQ